MLSSSFPLPHRLPGWEDRLVEVIQAARSEPYRLGHHDCFRVACRAVEALTGVNLWTQFAGTYRSKRDALRRIVEFHAGGFTAAASKLFGAEPQPMEFAHRGDICEFKDETGEQHLGVVMGVQVALLAPDGLEFVQRDACEHCWRIG